MEILILQVLIFVSVVSLVLGLVTAIKGQGTSTGVQLQGRPMMMRVFAKEIAAIGNMMEPTMNGAFSEAKEELRKNLVIAALADVATPRDVVGMNILSALSGFLVAGLLVFIFSFDVTYTMGAACAAAMLGWVYSSLWLKKAARSRQEEISKSMPYAIDLLTVAMQAGQDFGAAIRFLVTEGPTGPLNDEFTLMLRETELGKSRIEALRGLAERVQLDEMRALVVAVIQSTEMGSSVAATMKMQAEETRRARYHKAERKAARAPSIMLIPVALFILPAVFIIIFTPIFLKITEAMKG